LEKRNKIYFASDFHLGLNGKSDPVNREKHVVNWLDSVSDKAEAIYLVGDVFDFWWEYKKVVPRGFTRFLGKISELTDSGIEVHFFTGNHDMWIGDYLNKECGMILHTSPLTIKLKDKLVHIAHGDGLGVKDRGYKILLWIFRNRFIRKLYAILHPSIGVGIAHRWSLNSRLAKNYSKEFLGPENEDLFNYARGILVTTKVDYFIFGHRHIALDHVVGENSRLLIMGNWFNAPSYVELQEKGVELLTFPYS
jgi:UDP-2,3-diacylglucosamine hydrolase